MEKAKENRVQESDKKDTGSKEDVTLHTRVVHGVPVTVQVFRK